MKPAFALSLSFDGISLLHRCAGGWRNAGEVALDAPDLTTALGGLRGAASRLEPGPILTKLILPNDQIRYLSLETGTVDPATRDQMVREALDGATPYAVEELAYDISLEGPITHVAAVARETLMEAEAFAREHQFGPLSFVAVPGRKPFLGEPFFGPTDYAQSVLPAGERVEADGIAVVVVGPAEFPVPGADPTPEPAAPAPAAPAPAAAPETPYPADAVTLAPGAAQPAPPTPPAAEPDLPLGTFSSRRRRTAPAEAPAKAKPAEPPVRATPAAPVAEPAPASPPVAERPAPTPAMDTPDPAPAFEATYEATPPPLTAARPAPDLPVPKPSGPEPKEGMGAKAAGMLSGFRRKSPPEPLSAEPSAPTAAPAAPAREIDVSTMPPRLAAAVLKTPEPEPETSAPPVDERQRMTVFGAREPARTRAKPRYLGMILTAVLLLFLAGVAALASIFDDGALANLFGRGDRDTASGPASVSMPELQAPDIGADQALTTPIQSEEPVTLAAIDPGSAGLTDTDAAVLEALRDPRAPVTDQIEDHSDQSAETRYAVTGIWAEAPPEPLVPPLIGLDDLFLGAIDNRDLAQDAVALPDVASLQTDAPLGRLTSPAAPGVTYDFDERGLVRATPEGALTPDGYVVYLGRPPIVPPPTPDRSNVAEAAPDPQQERLAGFRPRLRPADLAERAERIALGGLTRDELAQRRPRARPAALVARLAEQKAAEETETAETDTAEGDISTATKLAVAQVQRPRTRPGDAAARVARAEKQSTGSRNLGSTAGVATGGDGRAGTQIASLPSRTVKPSGPTRASVSKQATVTNAINLRKVNLIGVYGTPSNRRALVRLPSGRYKKVQVGDTLDGGRISAIGDSELRYKKGSRNVVLKIPSG